MGLPEKLKERLEGKRFRKVELLAPWGGKKWWIAVRRHLYHIFVIAYENGRIEVDTGPVRTSDEIWDYLDRKKYGRKYREAKTEEEKEKVRKKRVEEEKRILEDFKQRRFEKYLRMKRKDIVYYAKEHMWADEIARRLSNKYGFEIKFNIDVESGFITTFDSTQMSDEQLIDEVLKRVDAMVEAGKMLESEDMMNEFLISRGFEAREDGASQGVVGKEESINDDHLR
ncbi:MAG: hypothetical protein N3F08_00395 [Crenarchaeota archaeon]|nr:hypothetical protein [Thermoproteota archaeon]